MTCKFVETYRWRDDGAISGAKIAQLGNWFPSKISHRRTIDLGEIDPPVFGATAERNQQHCHNGCGREQN